MKLFKRLLCKSIDIFPLLDRLQEKTINVENKIFLFNNKNYLRSCRWDNIEVITYYRTSELHQSYWVPEVTKIYIDGTQIDKNHNDYYKLYRHVKKMIDKVTIFLEKENMKKELIKKDKQTMLIKKVLQVQSR